MRIDRILRTAALQLARRQMTTPFLDAEVLLAYALNKSREYLAAHPEQIISTAQQRRYRRLVALRKAGTPVAYLRGYKEFYGLQFVVNRSVLIPRPESEAMVDAAIEAARQFRRPTIADLGTGSGNIAGALAKHLPRADVYATDTSRKALRVARKNAHNFGVRIHFYHGNLLLPLKNKKLDIITANLPYLPSSIKSPTASSLAYEPSGALYSGTDGLSHYRRLLKQIAQRRPLPQIVICEMLENQQRQFCNLVERQLRNNYQTFFTVVNGVAFVTLGLQKNRHQAGTIIVAANPLSHSRAKNQHPKIPIVAAVRPMAQRRPR